jgi:succinate dehydrogenase/fumarate reductase flavoprotein subunit
MTQAYEIIEHNHDVVIIGAGGAGLRAALGMASSGLRTACVMARRGRGAISARPFNCRA